jgi:hypothetical protein
VTAAAAGAVTRATRRDASAVEQLRRSCYARAPEFELLQPECLDWDACDDQAVVYQLHDLQGTLLATVRSHWVADAHSLAQQMGCECSLAADCFPTLFLSRGATTSAAARGGLHSLLRLHFLRAAQSLGAASATGAVYENAPRVRSMQLLGYEFQRPARVWDPEVRAIQPMLVACLPGRRVAAAVQSLELLLGDTVARYPIHFDPTAAHAPLALRTTDAPA